MMVVKLEMWPGGDAQQARVLAIGRFDLQAIDEQGARKYRVVLFKGTAFGGPTASDVERVHAGNPKDVWRTGVVEGHTPNSRGYWDLIGGALRDMLGSRLTQYRKGLS